MEKKIERRGRIAENDTVIEVYNQEFKDHNGEVFLWKWDKTKFNRGPLSVEIKDPIWSTFDKLEIQLSSLISKYEIKGKERKQRITKTDKLEIESLEYQINEIWYNNYPEDRPKVRKPRITKSKQMKPIKMKMLDMDTVLEYTTNNPSIIHKQTFEMLNSVFSKTKKPNSINLFVIELTDDEDLDEAVLNVEEGEWELALEVGLKFFEEKEEYEMCAQINGLLIKIKNSKK